MKFLKNLNYNLMAERVGFEPTNELPHCWFSRPVLSTAQPPLQIKNEILEGRSISLCFPEYNIYSSAIVGGSIPIAVGLAISIKRSNSNNRVYCFMGDMTSETGIAHECIKYSRNFKLPIHFIVEDNEKSVCTETRKAWNQKKLTYEGYSDKYVTYYHYKLKYPHAGAGKRIQF